MESISKALRLIVIVLVGVVWGYYTDLLQNEYGWFVRRLVFVLAVGFIAEHLLGRWRRSLR